MIAVEAENQTLESALARSALYGTIAGFFRRPDNPLFRGIFSVDERNALREAIEQSGNPGTDAANLAAENLYGVASGLTTESLLRDFVRIFGHTSRGAIPPYETEYGGGGPFFQPQELSDISGFYNAFGLHVDPTRNERLDHISCECEFMCFLCARQALALEQQDEAAAQEVARVQRLFLRDHLGRFGNTFFARIGQQPGVPWHSSAARFASLFLDSEFERFSLVINREYLPLRTDEEVNVPMACGGCDTACGAAGAETE